MSVYLDTITLLWGTAVLFIYSRWAVTEPTWISITGFVATALYLLAQTGWTVAFIQGDVWGRDFSNYVWFSFNTLVFFILTLIWLDSKKNDNQDK